MRTRILALAGLAVALPRTVGAQYSDGAWLYGFDEDGRGVRVDPRTGETTATATFTTQAGGRFTIAVAPGSLNLGMGGRTRSLPVLSADHPGVVVRPGVQVASGADGSLTVLVVGIVELAVDDMATVAGIVTVDAGGNVTAPEGVPDPFPASDPGDGSRVGVRPGDVRPWLMFIDPDAVRVYRRG